MAIDRKTRRFLAALVLVCASLALGRTDAIAQSPPKPGDELRPLFAMGSDIADGKELAVASCAKCHNVDGVSTTKGLPNIAGQRPSYMYLELKAYQSGARANADMVQKVKFLSDDAIAKVAAYYASLDPAEPPKTEPPKYIDPVLAGKTAAIPCAKCHGENGVSQKPGVPNLIGMAPKYLAPTISAYKTEDRKLDAKNEAMKTAISNLSDADVEHVALYYALQTENLTRAQTPADGDAAAGKEATAKCTKCHGDGGVSTIPANPSLAGQDFGYLLAALHSYKDGSRDDDTMGPVARKLDDVTMKNVAAYYAGLDPKPVAVAKPLSPAEWADKCDRCHGANGNSTRPNVPALAAQHIDYLEAVLREYQTGARQSPEMAAMSGVLTDDDIKGIAAHYAFQKARAVVFVTVPGK